MQTSRSAAAKQVLKKHWQASTSANQPPEAHTAADEALVAIGYGNFHADWVGHHLRQIFAAQRPDGFLPMRPNQHGDRLAFEPVDLAFHLEAPIAPPVFGFVLWHLYRTAANKARAKAWLQAFYPKVMQLHRYLYAFRDPQEEGLVCTCQPLETVADAALSPVAAFAGKTAGRPQPKPSTTAAEKWLADEDPTLELVQCPGFNALLAWSNECLVRIGSLLGEDVTEPLQWDEWTKHAMNEKLWDEASGLYQRYSFREESRGAALGLASLLPLCGEAPVQEQAERMLKVLEGSAYGGNRADIFLCPGNPLPTSAELAADYRACPVQLKYNWMLYHGLLRYDMPEMAERLRQHSLELLERYGFYEYFNPKRSIEDAFGNPACPVTAALGLDLLAEE